MSEDHYSKLSCEMVRVADIAAVKGGPPGSFCIKAPASGQRVMWIKLPNGDDCRLRLRPIVDGDTHPSWEWDGNEDRPTLSPSVHLPGSWHGWFRDGRMVSC